MTTINKTLQTLDISLQQLIKYNSYLESDQSFDDFYNNNYLDEVISQDYTYSNPLDAKGQSLVSDQEWLDYFKVIAKLAYNLNK